MVPNIYVSLGNDSIKASVQNLTWDEAKRRCAGEKANLASLRNEWTQAYAELLALGLKAPLWIGLNKKEVRGHDHHHELRLSLMNSTGRILEDNCLLVTQTKIATDHVERAALIG